MVNYMYTKQSKSDFQEYLVNTANIFFLQKRQVMNCSNFQDWFTSSLWKSGQIYPNTKPDLQLIFCF